MPEQDAVGGTRSSGGSGSEREFDWEEVDPSGADETTASTGSGSEQEFDWEEVDTADSAESGHPIPYRSRPPERPGGDESADGMCATGMTQLNQWLRGGLVKGSIVLVEGNPKSLSDEFLFNLLPNQPLVYYSGILPDREVDANLDTLKTIPSDYREIQEFPPDCESLCEAFAAHSETFEDIDRPTSVVIDSITRVEQKYDHDDVIDILSAFQESITDDMVGILHRDRIDASSKQWLVTRFADTIIEVGAGPNGSCPRSVHLAHLHPQQTGHKDVRDFNIVRKSDGEIEVQEDERMTST